MERLVAGDPTHIGAYRLLARLGAGGMGQVYLARSDRGRTVAVKLVRPELAEQEQFRGRFRQEVAAARRVGGMWTAPVLDADTEADVPWLATGYVAGPSLQTVVSGRHGPLPERSVRILASGLAHALQDIHAAGLIHRDLKPSNVLVTIEGPRVIDFGIARALETVAEESLTRTGALVGSPGFMAPEQVRGDRVTAACDIFCLGSVLAYATTGRLPFGGADTAVHVLMFRIAQEEPDLSGLPEGLSELVRDCLRKDPAQRPTTRDILARVGEAEDSGAGPGGEPWLPGGLLAQLGQHAVRLLEHEDPTGTVRTPTSGTEPGPAVPSGPSAPSAQSSPAMPTTPATPGSPMSRMSPHAPAAHPAPPAPTTNDQRTVPPPLAPAPPPASPYGYPGPPPQAGYGYPHTGYGSPAPAQEPAARSVRGTIALIAVAVVVAIGAGGSVYAVMRGDGMKKNDTAPVTDTASPGSDVNTQPPNPDSSTGAGSPSSPSGTAGKIPAEYLGTWNGSADSGSGDSSRTLVIRQGGPGDNVLTLTVKGPANGATYHCVFEAPLATAPAADGPLRIGPSEVTTGEPMSSCTPGAATELTILPDGGLRRVTTTGESLTYTKTG
ncbi:MULTISPECIES: serine/threonine-protein kinase [unclassified Streptomyces]|uniref:serine/threonine-protein kinase n=1 Tax=unclassified Streptomyces TaxID=2593676 RepID=UPI0038220691